MNKTTMNQQQVTEDVKAWIAEFVTKPNPLLQNLPPCPYAKQAVLEDKVQIVVPTEGTVSYAIQHALTNFDHNMDLVMLVFDPQVMDPETFEACVWQWNQTVDPQFVLLDDHPDNEENINGVTMNNGKYAIVFIQKSDKLDEASTFLETRTKYYKVWSQENLDDVVTWRKDRKKS